VSRLMDHLTKRWSDRPEAGAWDVIVSVSRDSDTGQYELTAYADYKPGRPDSETTYYLDNVPVRANDEAGWERICAQAGLTWARDMTWMYDSPWDPTDATFYCKRPGGAR
jgi:hypothetical protein